MPVAPVRKESIPEESIGSLRSCLVEGDSIQESRARRSKQRALLLSIAVQVLILAALVLFPLFSKGENIASRVFVPTVPYSPGRTPDRQRATTQPSRGRPEPCRFCPPPSIPHQIVMHDSSRLGDVTALDEPGIPGAPDGQQISSLGTPGSGLQPTPPVTPPRPKERLQISAPVQQAMLIRRVEPIYPPLGMQLRREGRVELHAIISTDGSIQSLEVITGDPLFIQSAMSAVREWRYRPTILDGQPIEVDTHITVVYTLNR
ncbi:MAG: energy transducer TonB [Candidatus Acidiferrum sp.]